MRPATRSPKSRAAAETRVLVQWLCVWGLAAFDGGRIPWRWYQWLASQLPTATAFHRTQATAAAHTARGLGYGSKQAEQVYRKDVQEAFGG